MKETNKVPRMAAVILEDEFVEGRGYRVGFVTEGQRGYRPTGNWPYVPGPGQQMPWFWGPTLADAERRADEYNERLGITREDASKLIIESMRGSGRRKTATRTKS